MWGSESPADSTLGNVFRHRLQNTWKQVKMFSHIEQVTCSLTSSLLLTCTMILNRQQIYIYLEEDIDVYMYVIYVSFLDLKSYLKSVHA